MSTVDGAHRPIDWTYVRDRGKSAALVTLFFITSLYLARTALLEGWIGADARIYIRGAAAWVAGSNPWDAYVPILGDPTHFAALPTAVVVLAPFTVLPEDVFVWGSVFASFAASIYIVRKLGLPWYFVAFPPLYQGVQSANPNIVLFALLLSGRPVLEALAPMLKVYAGIPMVLRGRWRSVGWTFLFGALTLLAVPLWLNYLGNFGTYSGRLYEEANGGYSALLWGVLGLIPAAIGLAVLWSFDRKAATWVAVPALWPASQMHYSIFAMPLMKKRPWLAAVLALPWAGVPAVVPGLLALEYALAYRRARATSPAEPADAAMVPEAV